MFPEYSVTYVPGCSGREAQNRPDNGTSYSNHQHGNEWFDERELKGPEIRRAVLR